MKKCVWFTGLFMSIFSVSQAQVPVSQEPMHHNILDNGHVRLLDVHIPAGDTTRYHIHATPSVFLVLTDANASSQVITEEDHSKSPIPHYGNIWFEGFYLQHRIHRVYNRDNHEYHVMDIELTNKNYKAIDSPIRQPAFSFLFEEKPVRAYRLTLGSGINITVPSRKADILMIQLTDSAENMRVEELLNGGKTAQEKLFHLKGDFIYIPSGSRIIIRNGGKDKTEFGFFELK